MKPLKKAKRPTAGVSMLDCAFAFACLVLSTWFLVSRGIVDLFSASSALLGAVSFFGGLLVFHGAKSIYLKAAKNAELGWVELVSVAALCLLVFALLFVAYQALSAQLPGVSAELPTPGPHAQLPPGLNATLGKILAADPQDEASCAALGGAWNLCGGLRPTNVCNLRATDAGKQCSSNSDCQAGCFGEVGSPPKKIGDWATGNCAYWLVCNGFGCYTQIEGGRVINSICVD